MERSFQHPKLGLVVVKENVRSRNITLRARPDAVHVTVPVGTPWNTVEKTLEKYVEPLMKRRSSVARTLIDYNFVMDAPLLHVSLREGKGEKFYIRREGRDVCITCPCGTQFDTPAMQEFLHHAIENAMRRQARNVLPPRLYMLAGQHGFEYSRLKISGSQGRWGSCSMRKSINLTYYLLLLPQELIDYVMLHELCHTREMNHSDRFWALMDSVTEGKAKLLRGRLKGYKTDF